MKDKVSAKLEEAAHILADANEVEAAWFLRGFSDGLLESSEEPPQGYAAEYRRGHKQGARLRNLE